MRKMKQFLFLLGILSLFVVSESSSNKNGEGSIGLKISQKGVLRTINPSISMETEDFEITGVGPNGKGR